MGVDIVPKLWTVVFTLLNTFILIIIAGIFIFGFVLFVKLARRGIKALDIYIKKNEKEI